MKQILYIFLLVCFSAITVYGIAGEPQKDNKQKTKPQQTDTLSRQKAVKKSGTIQSGWLNGKYFPQLRPSPCPFYIQPGC